MKRNGKIGVLAALLSVCLALTFVPTVSAAYNPPAAGFGSNYVEVKGENEAMNGWYYYFHNTATGWHYQSNEHFVRATNNGRTGNAIEIERTTVNSEVWIYSYSIDAEPNTTYDFSSFVKIANADGKLVYVICEQTYNSEKKEYENVRNEFAGDYSISGVHSDWTETPFSLTTTASTSKIIIRIRAEGTGIFDVDDVTVKKVYSNSISYRMMAIGNDGSSENPATWNELTADNLYDDSSDGDGKSLLLKDHDVLWPSFGMLPHGANYRLSFKYKSISGERLSIYMDNMNPAIERAWSVDGVSGGSTTEWTSYSYDFNAMSGQTDITFMRIASYGSYLIDELEIHTLNEYILNGSFENTKYYGRFTIGVGGSAITADNTVVENGNRAFKLDAGVEYDLKFSMILPKNKKYNISFRYKKLNESTTTSPSYGGTGLLIFADGYRVSDSSQFWDMGYNNPANVGEWVEFSNDFLSLGEGTADINHVKFVPCYGDYLIDDISVKCVDDTFADVQYIINGNFGGAYTNGYEFFGTTNFGYAKQSDGNFAFGSVHTTWQVGVGERGYFRILTDMLEKGKDYTLSFEYLANGVGVEVLGVYNGNASSAEKEFVSINTPVTTWTKHEATFTAGKFDQNFLEVYGSAYGRNTTFIRNIQITDGDGKTYITNQTLVAPGAEEATVYSWDFGTGDVEYKWNDWTIENGGIYGLDFEDGNNDWKICLNGSADKTATAISKDISVAGANVINVGKKVYYYTEGGSFGKNVTVTLLVGDKELTADENGYFILPEGTSSVKVKFAANEYVTFKYVDVQTHVHGETCANVAGEKQITYAFSQDNATCTATRYYACGVSEKTETVNTVVTGDTATFTETGTATCTATFADGDFETQTKTIETPMKSTPDVKMLKNGASIRANQPYGIRWAAGVKAADWNKLIELYGESNVKAGVIVAPLDYVVKAEEFTVDGLNAKSLAYSDIVTDMFNASASALVDGYNGFYASLVNIKDGNLNRKFAARAYVAVESDGVTTYYYGEYSAENQARSIYEVCLSVINGDDSDDVKAYATEVLNKVVNVKRYDDGRVEIVQTEGYTSPYNVTVDDKGVILVSGATADADASNIKIVCINGKNYKPEMVGGIATVVITAD